MINEETMSPLDSTSSTECFMTPISSTGDLIALSPNRHEAGSSQNYNLNITNDFLTGTEIENICDISMREVPGYEDVFLHPGDIDYLTDSTKSNISNIDSGKESLFRKFDPLYAKKKERTITQQGTVIECDVGYETGSSASTTEHILNPRRTNSTNSMPFTTIKEKPMQIVPPAVNHTIASTNPSQNRAIPALVRSASAIMSPGHVVIDRLINIAGNTPPVHATPRSPQYERYSQNTDKLYSLRNILQKQEQELRDLRVENNDLKYKLQNAEKKLSSVTEDLEAKIKKLSEDKDNLLEKECKLGELISEKVRSNKQLGVVMEEYEKTISWLITEQQQEAAKSKALQEKLISERDEALNHLYSIEGSFNDLLSKYEKCKASIVDVKQRERAFEEQILEYKEGLNKYESLYQNLKQVTSESLAKANENLDHIKKSHSAEITKYNATIKKQELTINSLRESLSQKDRDNQQLTSICDELINKVQ